MKQQVHGCTTIVRIVKYMLVYIDYHREYFYTVIENISFIKDETVNTNIVTIFKNTC